MYSKSASHIIMQCMLMFRYSLLKLASSDMSRVLDSWSALVIRINTLTFNTFQRNMQPYIDRVNEMADKFSSEETYSYFLNKVIIYIILLCTCVVCLCLCVCVCVCAYICVYVYVCDILIRMCMPICVCLCLDLFV